MALEEEICQVYTTAVSGIVELISVMRYATDGGKPVIKFERFCGFLIGNGYIASTAHGFVDTGVDGRFKILKTLLVTIGKKPCSALVSPVGINLSTDLALFELPSEFMEMEKGVVFPLGGETQVGESSYHVWSLVNERVPSEAWGCNQ